MILILHRTIQKYYITLPQAVPLIYENLAISRDMSTVPYCFNNQFPVYNLY